MALEIWLSSGSKVKKCLKFIIGMKKIKLTAFSFQSGKILLTQMMEFMASM
jgi:hypothetical protein